MKFLSVSGIFPTFAPKKKIIAINDNKNYEEVFVSFMHAELLVWRTGC